MDFSDHSKLKEAAVPPHPAAAACPSEATAADAGGPLNTSHDDYHQLLFTLDGARRSTCVQHLPPHPQSYAPVAAPIVPATYYPPVHPAPPAPVHTTYATFTTNISVTLPQPAGDAQTETTKRVDVAVSVSFPLPGPPVPYPPPPMHHPHYLGDGVVAAAAAAAAAGAPHPAPFAPHAAPQAAPPVAPVPVPAPAPPAAPAPLAYPHFDDHAPIRLVYDSDDDDDDQGVVDGFDEEMLMSGERFG